MKLPSWELSVLSRSVDYPNLSGAALHVGLSQPQLSRIVRKLEDELHVPLLDRRVRKLAAWTPQARELAKLWSRNLSLFEAQLQGLGGDKAKITWPKLFRVGAEPGLVPAASEFAHFLFERFGADKIEFEVQERSALEEACRLGDLHFICISRESLRRVSEFTRRIGWQILAPAGETARVRVKARSEADEVLDESRNRRSRGRDSHFRQLVSDSFEVRRHWIEERGAGGVLAGSAREKIGPVPAKQRRPVLLLGSKAVNSGLWDVVASEFHL